MRPQKDDKEEHWNTELFFFKINKPLARLIKKRENSSKIGNESRGITNNTTEI